MPLKYLKTTMEKAKGFMGRDHVGTNEAMLFVDVGPGSTFHMRTVKMPLGIAALDDEYHVLEKSEMPAIHGGYTTPSGTAHVLEFSPEIADQIIEGEEPNWTDLFDDAGPEIDVSMPDHGSKIIANLNPQAEMVKEIMTISLTEDEEPSEEAAQFVGNLMGEDFIITDYSQEMLKFEPAEGAADAEYYGEPILSDDLEPSSIAYNALSVAFGAKLVHKKGSTIYLKRFALRHTGDFRAILMENKIQVV